MRRPQYFLHSQLEVRELSFELDARRWLPASVNHDADLPSDAAYDLVQFPMLVPTALLSCPNMKMVSRCVIVQTHLWRSLCMDCRPRGHGKAPPHKRMVNSVMRLRLGQPAQHTCMIACIRIAWTCPHYIVRDASVMLPALKYRQCVYMTITPSSCILCVPHLNTFSVSINSRLG